MKTGKVYLIGAGPGDPGLLTLKGKRCLEEADVVIYDYLVDQRILAYARPEVELLYVGKKSGGDSVPQTEINRLMIKRAHDGETVARLKGGDPFLFGRGGEEAEELVAAKVPFEVVPGVTSALAVPAYAGIPVSHREYASAVAIVSGHKEVWENAPHLNWATLAGVGGTLVFLMGTRQLRDNMRRLINHGLPADTPVALIRWGTRPDQEVLTGTVGTIATLVAERRFEPPAIAVVGEVVRLRERLRWFDTKPLFGRRLVVTRPRVQASRFVELLEEHGAEVILFPTIATVPVESYEQLDGALADLSAYHWLIFTSVNGVQYFFARLRRAAAAREALPKELRALGARVDEIPVYQTIRPPQQKLAELRTLLKAGKIDLVTFTSSSTVRNFVALFPQDDVPVLLGKGRIGCIGPVTADTAREFGLAVAVQPQTYTIPAFAEAIAEYFSSQQSAVGSQPDRQ